MIDNSMSQVGHTSYDDLNEELISKTDNDVSVSLSLGTLG